MGCQNTSRKKGAKKKSQYSKVKHLPPHVPRVLHCLHSIQQIIHHPFPNDTITSILTVAGHKLTLPLRGRPRPSARPCGNQAEVFIDFRASGVVEGVDFVQVALDEGDEAWERRGAGRWGKVAVDEGGDGLGWELFIVVAFGGVGAFGRVNAEIIGRAGSFL